MLSKSELVLQIQETEDSGQIPPFLYKSVLKVGEFGLRKKTISANNSFRRGEHWLPPDKNET